MERMLGGQASSGIVVVASLAARHGFSRFARSSNLFATSSTSATIVKSLIALYTLVKSQRYHALMLSIEHLWTLFITRLTHPGCFCQVS
jgi:hypothetical protein